VNVRLVRGENEANFFMLKRKTRHLTHPLGKGHRDFSHFKRCKNTSILIAMSADNNSPIICSLLALLIHRGVSYFYQLQCLELLAFKNSRSQLSCGYQLKRQQQETANSRVTCVFCFNQNLTLNRTKLFKPKNLKSTWKCTRNCPPVKSLGEIQ
jgi:hypothetical protein